MRLRSGDLRFDQHQVHDVVDAVRDADDRWRVVVTPNLYHLRMLNAQPELLSRYRRADIVVPDGWPVVSLLRRRTRLEWERVTGADILENLLGSNGGGRSLLFVGGIGSEQQEDELRDRGRESGWNVEFEPAPQEELADAGLRADLIRRIVERTHCGVVVLSLGAPKQEQLAFDIAQERGRGWLLCFGMAMSFSSGHAKRAPTVLQAARLEWMWRIWQEPRRLAPRYASDALALFGLMYKNRQQFSPIPAQRTSSEQLGR